MSTPKKHGNGVCRLLSAWADEKKQPGDFSSIFGSLNHPLEAGSTSASVHTKKIDAVVRSSESNSRFGGFLEQIGYREDSPEESEDSMPEDEDFDWDRRAQTCPTLARSRTSMTSPSPMNLLPGAALDSSVVPYRASKRHSQRRFLISSQFTNDPLEFLQRSPEAHPQDDVQYRQSSEIHSSVSFTACSVRDESTVVRSETARTSEYSLLLTSGQTLASGTSVVAAGDNYLEELSLCTPIFESIDAQTGSAALASAGSEGRRGSGTEETSARFVSEKSGGWRSIGENWNNSRLRKIAVRFRNRLSTFTHRRSVKLRNFTDMQRQLENNLLEKCLARHQPERTERTTY